MKIDKHKLDLTFKVEIWNNFTGELMSGVSSNTLEGLREEMGKSKLAVGIESYLKDHYFECQVCNEFFSEVYDDKTKLGDVVSDENTGGFNCHDCIARLMTGEVTL